MCPFPCATRCLGQEFCARYCGGVSSRASLTFSEAKKLTFSQKAGELSRDMGLKEAEEGDGSRALFVPLGADFGEFLQLAGVNGRFAGQWFARLSVDFMSPYRNLCFSDECRVADVEVQIHR